jgi:hypothetical protein
MPELVVLGFEGIYRATEVLRDLRDLQAERKIDLADAVAVYRSPRCWCLPTRPIRRLLPSGWAATGGGRFFARRCRLRRWNGCSGSESVNELAASARLRSSSSLKCARIFSYVTLPGLWSLRVDAHGRPPR